MAVNRTQLPFNFHWERDFSVEFVHALQFAYPLLSLLTWHPAVLYILTYHSDSLSKEIRAGYIANQICLIIFEWSICLFIRIYPLMPYPAIYCDGPLCRLGLPQQVVTTFLAVAVILLNIPFVFLLMSMHQKLLVNSDSRARLSERMQYYIMYTLVFLLLLNVVGFAVFGASSEKSDEIRNRPELVWLSERGGQLLIFGDVGEAGYFAYECYILAISLLIGHPPVVFFCIHASYIMNLAKGYTMNRTAILQKRMMSVLLIQLCTAFFFYCTPLAMMITAIIFIFPYDLLPFARPCFLIAFILTPMPQSLVFLLKNAHYRKVINERLLGRIFDYYPEEQQGNVSMQRGSRSFQ